MAMAETSNPKRAAARQRRRQQLIDATIKCIARNGMSNTTLADVSAEAGLSQGIVNLHFESKDNLLSETLRFLADEYRMNFDKAIERAANSPADQLRAVMEMDLRPSVSERRKVAVWFAFWGEVKSRPAYQKICDESDRSYDDTVEGLCAAIIEEGGYDNVDAATVRLALMSMTNGMWLHILISPQSWDRQTGLNSIHSYLAGVFPKHFEAPGTT